VLEIIQADQLDEQPGSRSEPGGRTDPGRVDQTRCFFVDPDTLRTSINPHGPKALRVDIVLQWLECGPQPHPSLELLVSSHAGPRRLMMEREPGRGATRWHPHG
jgi:hypothetical protein